MKAACAAAIVLACAAGTARAQSKPWAQGVDEARQARANALFEEGNRLFAEKSNTAALERYRAAIAIWDHPMVQFNMAVTLIRLDRLLDAAEALDRALRYGAQPFTPELYQQALDYRRLLGGRVGTVEASCTQDGVQVLLDGSPWFVCPGTQQRRVLAGEHAIVATGATYQPLSRRVIVAGGVVSREALKLVALDAAVRLEYPTARWIPWTVAAVGAAVGFGGLGVWFSGRGEMDRFDERYAIDCWTGCETDLSAHDDLRALRDGARRTSAIGVSMMIAGGVVAVGGVIWGGALNRPRRVLPKLELAPSPGGMTARAGWEF
jgi:hypothetical protein